MEDFEEGQTHTETVLNKKPTHTRSPTKLPLVRGDTKMVEEIKEEEDDI